MANSREIIRYKQQIMSMLIKNEDIVSLISDTSIENTETLIGVNFFNYIRVPEAPEEEKTYICIEVSIPDATSSTNTLFKTLCLTIYIITHERLMSTTLGGARTDLISASIDEMLNQYEGIGIYPLELKSNIADSIGIKHRCRIMTFLASDLNNPVCKIGV